MDRRVRNALVELAAPNADRVPGASSGLVLPPGVLPPRGAEATAPPAEPAQPAKPARQAPAAPEPPPPVPAGSAGAFNALSQIKQEKQADHAFDFALGTAWPALALLGGPSVSALVAPAVAEQRSVLGVFFATLAWSAGIALMVLVYRTKAFGEIQSGVSAALIAFGCLGGGVLVAAWIGAGSYAVTIPFGEYGGTPVGWIMPFAVAALESFGAVGAILGATSGVLAGKWAADLHDAT